MKNSKKIKYIFGFLCILWMAFIFSVSRRNGTVSSRDSDTVAQSLYLLFFPSADVTSESVMNIISAMIVPVRKSAHVIEYTILGFLACGFFCGDKQEKIQSAHAFLFCFIYRASDEIHQYFVPGRACRFTDVLIDSAGIIIGIAILRSIAKLIQRKSKDN